LAALTSFPIGYRAVVVGTTGGIGQAFIENLRTDANCAEVIALSRSTVPRLDLQDEASVEAAAAMLALGGPVHLVIDATGILHDAEMKPEKSIDAVDPENMARAFAINATGPLLLLKHFHRLLPRDERSVFATLSARVGSIEDNRLGGWYGYRASKAALNMFLRTAAIEIARKRRHAVCLALHPGTVKTGLSEPFSSSRKRFEPEQAASLLLNVINRATSDDTGSFLAYDGSVIPW
jgi:NAD(P)-dependent dehydrogenase (short-subunit alcohol dehydrogenase family)